MNTVGDALFHLAILLPTAVWLISAVRIIRDPSSRNRSSVLGRLILFLAARSRDRAYWATVSFVTGVGLGLAAAIAAFAAVEMSLRP